MKRAPWGYAADNGPACWALLDPDYRLCGCGAEQSPVDLSDARAAQLAPLRFDYGPARATIEDTGPTVQFNPGSGHGLVIGRHRHELRQFHFHHASEHLVEGTGWPMELHFVHTDGRGGLAVVGVFIGEGQANSAVEVLWQTLVDEPESLDHVDVDLAALLPATTKAWRYRGSLTTPPCSEGVNWIVLADILTLSVRQIAAFTNYRPANCRPVQPLGGRVITIG